MKMSNLNPAGLVTSRSEVLPEWVDYNGHLRDGFYLVLFSYGVDGFMDQIGLDAAGRKALGHSLFTLEAHLNFLHEVKLGTRVEVRTQVLGIDAKRVHLGLGLYEEGQDKLLSFCEQMQLNVDMAGPTATPFAPSVAALLQPLALAHAGFEKPKFAGRVIALPQPKVAR
jgi:acyl-CoA thioester hydrolase